MSEPDAIGVATRNQDAASDPAVSAFVSASAGSGKTKVLTDRLLRLMLAGADPGRIQCLTYTRAAAAEMASRLHGRLGGWVRAEDAALDEALRALALEPDAALRQTARTLFARVLDLPGGMRIDTIHAFCQSLLRRFPLEAGLSPHFEVLDDLEAGEMRQSASDAALRTELMPHIEMLAPQMERSDFARLVGELSARRERLRAGLAALGLEGLVAAQHRVLRVAPGRTADEIRASALAALDRPALRQLFGQVGETCGATIESRRQDVLAVLAQEPAPASAWMAWRGYFLKSDGGIRAEGYLCSARGRRKYPDLLQELQRLAGTVLAVEDETQRQALAGFSAALLRLAEPELRLFEQRKQREARLDYGDMIDRTRALLLDPGTAWVLYKLDGGLDHLLLDEVQDTAPDQWRVADALTAEFFAGQGAREVDPPRSIFAVGDPKQSIYSFQGAEVGGFDEWRERISWRVQRAGGAWRSVPLEVSFRSTAPVLALTDAVFALPQNAMGLAEVDRPRHLSARAGDAGRVELWPLAPKSGPDGGQGVLSADTAPGGADADTARGGAEWLADGIALWLRGLLDRGEVLASEQRAIHAGDVLVLVRNRARIAPALVAALKRHGVPVAGLDEMRLAEQPAVADLLSLCEWLLLPEDDLSLAEVLTSPLGNLSDESLLALAAGRTGSLWQALRARADERGEWRAACDYAARLLGRTDFISPHALLVEALADGARARLFARLGPQAMDPLQELLRLALEWAQTSPPSLQGFLHHLRLAEARVKRQPDAQARTVRIMTVHGAKGLEAPVVILPASFGSASNKSRIAWASDPQSGQPVPLWGPRKDTLDETARMLIGAQAEADKAEQMRLLYVALTRARDRLVVCGWETGRAATGTWHAIVAEAMATLPEVTEEASGLEWGGQTLVLQSPQLRAVTQKEPQAIPAGAALPDWAGAAPAWRAVKLAAEAEATPSLAPSRPQDAALGQVPRAASPLTGRAGGAHRFVRGQLVHSLLQHLPDLAPGLRRQAAERFLAAPGHELPPGQAAQAVDETLALLDAPELSPLFGPGSRAEVPLTGRVFTATGPAVVGGVVDRLAESAGEIWLADYKTNRDPPAEVSATPALYLRQLAGYRAVLAQIYPERPIRCVLIWTRTARADWLPDAMLDATGIVARA